MRVKVSGIYYKRNKTTCNYISGEPCLVKWKNKAENVSGFLHALSLSSVYTVAYMYPWL